MVSRKCPTLQAKPMKRFPSEYYCNKRCLSGTPILHAEFLSTVQWDFWQELARSIWDLSIRQRCSADGGKRRALTLRGYRMMHGSSLDVSKHNSQLFGQYPKEWYRSSSDKMLGGGFN